MAIPLIKVYERNQTTVEVDLGRGNKPYGAKVQCVVKPVSFGDLYPENDRISLYCAGIALFTDKYPHQIADASGNQVGSLADVLAYFDELGIGQEQGGGGGITPEQLNTILQGYVTKAEYNILVERVVILEENAGYIQLDTPVITISNITQTGSTATWVAIENATSYDVYLGNTLVTTVTGTTYNFTGLTANTPYTPGVVAKGDLPNLPSDLGTVDFTTLPAQQTQLGTPVPVTSNITSNSITISWPAVANATTYEIRRNNVPLTAVQGLTYTDNGLSPSTQYQYIVIAKAAGYIDSAQGIVSGTTQSGQQPGNQNIFPLTFPFQFAS